MAAANKQEKPPVKYYELVDKKSSGFIMDGTKGTVYQQELMGPAMRWIPTKGRTAVKGEKGAVIYKEIKFVNGCNTIDPEEQKKMGIQDKPFEDKIGIENGFMTVERSGNTIALYDYLEQSFYNLDNPDRPASATPLYREVKLDKKAVTLLDEDELQTQAKSFVYGLRLSTGDKKTPYKYDLDRIDAVCRMVDVWDETPERKLILLLQKANDKPKEFLDIVVKAEQTVITEVSHALTLGVIVFDKNTAQYTDGENEVIYTVDADLKKIEQKISALAAWLSTNEGTPALTKLRTKIEIAKDKELQ